MATRIEFVAFMAKLAKAVPKFAPDVSDKALLEIWFEELGPLDTQALSVIYKHAVLHFKEFPSIKDCLEVVGKAGASSPQDKGREVADRIWTAISKFGGYQPEKAKEFIGDLGWLVVEMSGGWSDVCNVELSDEGIRKAQWRGSAEVYAKKGGLGEAPTFDKPGLVDRVVQRLAAGEDPNGGRG